MTDLRAYAREAATRAGCNPDLFIRQIEQESGFEPDAHNTISGAHGVAQLVARWHPGVDPSDPEASLEYAARLMAGYLNRFGTYRRALAAYNWGSGNVGGYTKPDDTIVPPWDGRRESLPDETRRYLDAILGPGWPEPGADPEPGPVLGGQRLRVTDDGVRLRAEPSTSAAILAELPRGTLVAAASPYDWRQVRLGNREGWIAAGYLEPAPNEPVPVQRRYVFDPRTPTYLQRNAWTCAIGSVIWCLRSIGIAVTPEAAHDAMVPRYVTSDDGLLDASGAGMVEVLRDQWGVTAFNRAPASFDHVAGWAGRCPVAIGGRAWGHWTAVRSVNEVGSLVLANPGGNGPRYGQQTLDRQQFADLGWFSAVVIPVE